MSTTSAQPLPALAPAQWNPGHNPWLIAVAVTLATFMEVLDVSIANVALPHIAGNLSATVEESTWVLTSYLVSNAIVLPLSGFLSSLFGRKRFYMTCVVLFAASSMACGFAPSLGWLVFFRVLQGLGGGGLQPSEQAILVDSFPASKRGMSMAVYGIAVVCAPILGPTLGGWITDNFSWRWVFFINVPVGILSLFLTWQLVHDPPYLPRRRGKDRWNMDFIGLGLIAVGLGALQVVLDKGEREDWLASGFIRWFAVIAAVGIVAAVIWEWRHKDPLVDLHLLKERNFASAAFIMLMVGVVLFGSIVLMPLMLQTLFGYTATDAGMVLSPGGVVTMAMMPVVGFALGRLQPRWLIALGTVAVSISLFMMADFSLDIDFKTAMVARMVQGFGLAFMFVPINTAAYSFIPREKNNAASGLINLARNLGGSIGIALVTTMLARGAQTHHSQLAEHVSEYNPTYRTMVDTASSRISSGSSSGGAPAPLRAAGMIEGQVSRQATMLAFLDCYRLLAWVFLGMLPVLLLMRKADPTRGGGGGH